METTILFGVLSVGHVIPFFFFLSFAFLLDPNPCNIIRAYEHNYLQALADSPSPSEEVAFFLFIVSSIYGVLFMPEASPSDDEDKNKDKRANGGFFAPLKVIRPQKYLLENGKVIKNYGLVFLSLGIFLGVVSGIDALVELSEAGLTSFLVCVHLRPHAFADVW